MTAFCRIARVAALILCLANIALVAGAAVVGSRDAAVYGIADATLAWLAMCGCRILLGRQVPA